MKHAETLRHLDLAIESLRRELQGEETSSLVLLEIVRKNLVNNQIFHDYRSEWLPLGLYDQRALSGGPKP